MAICVSLTITEPRELTLIAGSGIDIPKVLDFIVKSEALLSGALLTHLVVLPLLHFARIVDASNVAEVTGPKVLAAAAFGGFDCSRWASMASTVTVGAGSCWRQKFRVHSYVGEGYEAEEVPERMPEWETVLNAGGEMPIALVAESGMFDGITLEGTDEENSNFSDLISELHYYGLIAA